MRKTIIKTKKAASPKKAKTVAKKKNLKTGKNKKPKTSKLLIYPEWTVPVHLNEKDHKNLKRFYELFIQGKFDVALSFASSLDTIVREEIPSDIWVKTGGKLTKKGKEELKNDTEKSETAPFKPVCPKDDTIAGNEEKTQQEATQRHVSANTDAKRHLYVLKNGKLQTVNGEYSNNGKEMNEAKFHTKSDLIEFILGNCKTLFGENIVLVDDTKSTNEYFPNVFLFDFNEQEKPRMYIIEINFSDDSLGLLYARVTHFIASLKNRNYQNDFLAELLKLIDADKQKKNELQARLREEQDISKLLSEMLANKPAILLVRDNENVVLNLMQAVYIETWGKMVRQIMIKKYYCGNDKIFSAKPDFADIWKNEKSRKTEIVKSTEEDHLKACSEIARNIYNEIKTALLKADNSIEFNAKKIYISVRKNKNLAFFHLRKKISLVVMCPEEDVRKQIKYHEIKSLPASVQKFWNGASCTIVIENSANIAEVINLLKKMIAKS